MIGAFFSSLSRPQTLLLKLRSSVFDMNEQVRTNDSSRRLNRAAVTWRSTPEESPSDSAKFLPLRCRFPSARHRHVPPFNRQQYRNTRTYFSLFCKQHNTHLLPRHTAQVCSLLLTQINISGLSYASKSSTQNGPLFTHDINIKAHKQRQQTVIKKKVKSN